MKKGDIITVRDDRLNWSDSKSLLIKTGVVLSIGRIDSDDTIRTHLQLHNGYHILIESPKPRR